MLGKVAATFAVLGLTAAGPLPAIPPGTAQTQKQLFFKNSDLGSVLPLPPADTPESLQGIFWMDQIGHLSHSDMGGFPFSLIAAPDLALSFGGDQAFHKLDRQTRTLNLDITGPAWQWFNSALGYVFPWALRKIGFYYSLEFNEDYTFAQILPSLVLPLIGTIQAPRSLVSFTMVRQTPPAGICPPKPDAPKKDFSKCAAWDRVSSGPVGPALHYYVFQIMDKDGEPVQPYYDAFMAYADKSSSPSSAVASVFGVDLGEVGKTPATSFVHRRESSSDAAKSKATEL